MALLGVSAAGAVAAEVDTIAAHDPGSGAWYLRDDAGSTASFYYGDPGDIAFLGDWDCDGVDTPGLYRQSDGFVYLRNSNTQGIADLQYFFGDSGDVPLAGDFDGDGCDSVALYRPSQERFYIINELGTAGEGIGAASSSFLFGNGGDIPLVGDFDGDGNDDFGVYRSTTGRAYLRTEPAGGPADIEFDFGSPGDRILAGDWTGAGPDTLAVYRPSRGRYFLRYQLAPGVADETIAYGPNGWVPLAGKFDLDAPATGKGTLVISATGDVNLDGAVVPTLRTIGPGYAWSGLEGILNQDDLTVINLECAPSQLGSAVPKTFNHRCDSAGVATMAASGVDVANLANNHTQDYGTTAFLDGIGQVASSGVAPVGAGANLAEATAPALFEINGWTVAVVGFNGVADGVSRNATSTSAGVANGDDAALMAATVAAAKQQADLVFVTVHWGSEQTFVPDAADRPRALAMIDAGADAVFGHGPHWLQHWETYTGKPIFWSLGNFVWRRHAIESRTTALAEVVVQPDGLIHARLIPGEIVAHGHPVLAD